MGSVRKKKKNHDVRFALFLFVEDKFKGQIHRQEHRFGFLQILDRVSPDCLDERRGDLCQMTSG